MGHSLTSLRETPDVLRLLTRAVLNAKRNRDREGAEQVRNIQIVDFAGELHRVFIAIGGPVRAMGHSLTLAVPFGSTHPARRRAAA
jgi:hypothetical protein